MIQPNSSSYPATWSICYTDPTAPIPAGRRGRRYHTDQRISIFLNSRPAVRHRLIRSLSSFSVMGRRGPNSLCTDVRERNKTIRMIGVGSLLVADDERVLVSKGRWEGDDNEDKATPHATKWRKGETKTHMDTRVKSSVFTWRHDGRPNVHPGVPAPDQAAISLHFPTQPCAYSGS